MKYVAIAGNPNCGKSTLFTKLTGIYQKNNNYPGVTVEKKEAIWKINKRTKVQLTDLPGLYSLYPEKEDEIISYKQLMGIDRQKPFDLIIVILDACNLKRNLLLLTQLSDMRLPLVVALSMTDLAHKRGISIDPEKLGKHIGYPVVAINSIKNQGIQQLVHQVNTTLFEQKSEVGNTSIPTFLSDDEIYKTCPLVKQIKSFFPKLSTYTILHRLLYSEELYNKQQNPKIQHIIEQNKTLNKVSIQSKSITQRYNKIQTLVSNCEQPIDYTVNKRSTELLDKILLHPFGGYLFLVVILLISFQFLFFVADYPMQMIDSFFFTSGKYLKSLMPNTWWSSMLIDGLWAGFNGILVFVPQIALLFGIIAALEASGYMSRMTFLMDQWTRLFGLNGKSVVVFANAFACVVPAIMSARHIESKRERLITILVAPFMACSARLPVYVILISLVSPDIYFLGIIQLKALLLLGLYMVGIVVAFIASFFLRYFIKTKEHSIFIQELPIYRMPYWKNIIKEMYLKSKIFVVEAGKIIIIISLVIWFLSSFGPNKRSIEHQAWIQPTHNIEQSYIGHIGKWIEPAIIPLGYDWKIGIALLTSLAAREVFVGTLSTIYAVENDEDSSLINKMKTSKRPNGSALYSTATILSLLIFYALAMQCMSTFVIVQRETKSWKYPLAQLGCMTVLAYLSAWVIFQLLV